MCKHAYQNQQLGIFNFSIDYLSIPSLAAGILLFLVLWVCFSMRSPCGKFHSAHCEQTSWYKKWLHLQGGHNIPPPVRLSTNLAGQDPQLPGGQNRDPHTHQPRSEEGIPYTATLGIFMRKVAARLCDCIYLMCSTCKLPVMWLQPVLRDAQLGCSDSRPISLRFQKFHRQFIHDDFSARQWYISPQEV